MSVEVRSVSHEYVERKIVLHGVTSKYALGIVTQLLANFILYKKYKIKVLDNTNLKVNRNEFLCILGANGSGKTTLLKIIGGLLKPTKGDVLINGYSITKDEDIALRQVMYIPGALVGGAILSPELTVRMNLKRLFEFYRVPLSKIDEALKIAKLEEYAERRVGSLSSGLVARLMLISALYSDAPVILLDEPLVGVSFEAVLGFHDFIKNRLWKEKGCTIIYATNNINEAQRLSRNIVILHRGRIIASGSLYELVNQLGLREVIEVKVYTPLNLEELRNMLVNFGERREVMRVYENCYLVKIIASNSEEIFPELIEKLVKNYCKILSVKVRDISLEEVFMYYIGRSSV